MYESEFNSDRVLGPECVLHQRSRSWLPALKSVLLMAFVSAAGAALGGQTADGEAEVKCRSEQIDFERQIRPLFLNYCSECHGPEVQKSGLRLDARHSAFRGGDGGAVITAGSSSDSELLRRIMSSLDDERMPPDGPAMKAAEVELLRRWIDDGAEWPETEFDRNAARDRRLEHWSFQPLAVVNPPAAESLPLSLPERANEIDLFVSASLARHGLSLSAMADRQVLIRRSSLDLLGLPPSPEEVASFAEDTDPHAWRKLVERLLSSPRYGERWAQHWLDVARYADTHGFEVNTPRENAWPYRDYVIRSFNEDKPYDQFILEQLAGDLFQSDDATGFMVAAAVLLPGQIGADEESKRLARQDALDEVIIGTSGTLLGLTIGCARCHDHKFDPVTAEDYYALQAYFAGVDYGDRPFNNPEHQQNLAKANALAPRIEELQQTLSRVEPQAYAGRTLIIDERDAERVTFLRQENGPGNNPAGTLRGYKDDAGSAIQLGNLSGGGYTWWDNKPGEDVLTYNPAVDGTFRLWISWGVHGSGVHTRDARYLLDVDGDPATRNDQRELARVDQYYLAGVNEGESEKKPLWSGLLDVGVVQLAPSSTLILRGGDSGTGITADVIVLQELPVADSDSETQQSAASIPLLPRLREPITPQMNIDRFAPMKARFVRFSIHETINNNQHEPCIDELEIFAAGDVSRNLALAAAGAVAASSGNYSETGIHQLKHVNDGRYGNGRSWISSQHGGGWVQIELPEAVEIDRVVWSRDRNGKFKDRLPVKYSIHLSVDGQSWQFVAGDADRIPQNAPFDPVLTLVHHQPMDAAIDLSALAAELKQLQQTKEQLETPQSVFAGRFREPDTTFVLRRGDPEQRVAEILPAIPALFASTRSSGVAVLSPTNPGTEPTDEQARRLSLADWIVSPDNPLTARVMVNRIWLWHFGRGLVDTPSDFGINGTPPTHPELLDWLAGEFVRSGWSVKYMHRLIMNSATYRQSHQLHPDGTSKDGENRLLWRFASRRLEAEAIRDCMLTVSGELNLKMGGPGFNLFRSRGGLDGFPPIEEFTANELRRMIYSHKVRMEQVPVFGAFDCPDAGQPTPRRSQSTTAIQALNLFNSSFVIERADKFAERIMHELPDDQSAQLVRAFELALCRPPSADELSASKEVAGQHGLNAVCRVLLNSSEFLFIP